MARSLTGAFGALLALVCARLRGPFLILSTLAAAEVVRIGALNWASLTGRPGRALDPTDYRACAYGFRVESHLRVMMLLLSFGGLRNDEVSGRLALRLLSVFRSAMMRTLPVPRVSTHWRSGLLRWRSAPALTGIGGSLFAQYFLYLDPTFIISPELSFQFALLAAVGGLGTAIGPVLGSFLITPMSELLRSYLRNAKRRARTLSFTARC